MQIFSPAADTALRFGAVALILCLIAAPLGAWEYLQSTYETQVGWVQDQPVPFSHAHHVGDDGIDCRYCHTSVETSARANLPPTHTCMTCHSQIWTGAPVLEPVRQSMATGEPIHWQRVAQLPDYVYFDHSIHIDRGVACRDCHGDVTDMPLMRRAKPFTMEFCLDCHRDPAPALGPAELVTRPEPVEWSEEQKRAYGKNVMHALGIEVGELDNCGVCHR